MMALARIQVKLKPTVLDAQGAQVKHALQSLGFEQVNDVRMGRYIEVELPDGADAERQVRAMCERLLANPVIETYDFELEH
jgi:phosphoribosylformylglycinamidine synthase subunit PurS